VAGTGRTRRRNVARVVSVALGIAVLGALVGFMIAVLTPARVEIAGSPTRVWLELGRNYDQVSLSGILTGRRQTTRSIFGEPLGVRAVLNLNTSQLTTPSGEFSVNVLPAYIQAYSDPAQLVHDMRHALVVHLVAYTVLGALGALVLYGLWHAYRTWRRNYDQRNWPDPRVSRLVRQYRTPERTLLKYAVVAGVVVVVIGAVPSALRVRQPTSRIVGDSIFDGTPLAGIKVEGVLRPAFVAVESYVETYFDRTNTYYDQLRDKLDAYLAHDPEQLPGVHGDHVDDDIVQLGFVTDRHCNIGMDRVIVDLLQHYDVHTLLSGGDDAFSGSFAFESACTRNLADKTNQAGIDDIFVGGNHDSPMTLADELDQGITTLDGPIVEHDGLQFIGSPDPRTSRYGQGIVPSSRAAQDAVLAKQAKAIAQTACNASGSVIAVLHDPLAGRQAMRSGCGHITIALDGHLHRQIGPLPVPLADGRTGYQFVGASSGGAPSENIVDSSFASQLTVGPLNHDAVVNIVSVRRSTGELVGVTEFRFTPDQRVLVTHQLE
jgi:preprotein translocase subunit Sss1